MTANAADGPEGAASNAQAVEGGHADLAFSRADLAYQVYRQPAGASAPAHLRSIAVLYTNAVHLLVRRASGITRGADMRGHRVQMADDAGGGSGGLTRLVVEGYGLSEHDVKPVGNSRMRLPASGPISSMSASSRQRIRSPRSMTSGLRADCAAVARARGHRSTPIALSVLQTGGHSEGFVSRTGRRRPDRRDRRPAPVPRFHAGIDGVCADPHAVRSAARPRARPCSARLIDAGQGAGDAGAAPSGAARYYRERDLFR